MNAKTKAKWIAALRSGAYKQGKTYLRKGECFCCLGVLCEVTGRPPVDGSGDDIEERSIYGPLARLLGVDYDQALNVGATELNDLISMNDNDNRSFADIADWIETHL